MALRNEDEYTVVERTLRQVRSALVQPMAILSDSRHPMFERVNVVSKQLLSIIKSLEAERDKL